MRRDEPDVSRIHPSSETYGWLTVLVAGQALPTAPVSRTPPPPRGPSNPPTCPAPRSRGPKRPREDFSLSSGFPCPLAAPLLIALVKPRSAVAGLQTTDGRSLALIRAMPTGTTGFAVACGKQP